MTFDLVQMVYWLSLSAWFGLVLFAAMATPVIFRTLQEADPTLPTVLSVNLDAQHGTLLAMTLISNILGKLVYVQIACAIGLLLAIAGQWMLIDRSDQAQFVLAVVRSVLLLAAGGLLIYAWRVLWPRAARERQAYIDNADNPEAAETARAQLTRTQREGEIVQLAIATILSALILFAQELIRHMGRPSS